MKLAWEGGGATLYHGDALAVLRTLPDESVHMVCCSPPYWALRAYSTAGQVWGGDENCSHEWGTELPSHHPGQVEQTKWKNAEAAGKGQTAASGQFCAKCGCWRGELGLEPHVGLYVEHLVMIFREVKRVLRNDGTFFLNIADSYSAAGYSNHKGTGGARREDGGKQHHTLDAGLPPKSLCMVPARVALALQDDGWILRSMAPWVKRAAMPESCEDRPTSAVEYIFQFAKSQTYFFDMEAIRKPFSTEPHAPGNKPRDGITAQKRWKQGTPTDPSADPERVYGNPNGRSRRNADWWFESMGIRLQGDEVVGYDVNPQPFDMQLCTTCKTAYDGAEHRQLKEDAEQRRICRVCGAADRWLSHYAAYPTALVTPIIRAATSEYGCCEKCGAAWERVVEKVREGQTLSERPGTKNGDFLVSRYGAPHLGPNAIRKNYTTGWQPTCSCSASVVPSVVLDPFSGVATTGIAALLEGRRYIGVDLNEDYLALSAARIRRVLDNARYGKADAQERRKAAAQGMEQLSLSEVIP